MKLIAGLTASALLAVSAFGQTPCYAENAGPSFLNKVSMGGPNLLLAVRFTPNVSVTVRRIEVFTGKRTGANSVAIWTHNATGNSPGTQISSGSWNMSSTNSWQGANLAAGVPIVASTTYWMVWGCQNGSQAPVEQKNTLGQPYRGSFNGGTSWNGPFQFNNRHWKFSFFCKKKGTFATQGTGCKGRNGNLPVLSYSGTPEIGNGMSIHVAAATPHRPAILFLGASKKAWGLIPLPLDLTPIGAPGCKLLCSGEAILPNPTDASGNATQNLAIPNAAALVCLMFYNQWIIVDPGANTAGLALSNCGLVTIGG